MTQDALYLRDYDRFFAAVGSRADGPAAMRMFAGHAADAVATELELRATLLAISGGSTPTARRNTSSRP